MESKIESMFDNLGKKSDREIDELDADIFEYLLGEILQIVHIIDMDGAFNCFF
jgi:hypothetical protein